jgi:hypothetical protein
MRNHAIYGIVGAYPNPFQCIIYFIPVWSIGSTAGRKIPVPPKNEDNLLKSPQSGLIKAIFQKKLVWTVRIRATGHNLK